MIAVYLGLGSNLGDRERNLREALRLLSCPELRILRVSSICETDPVGYLDQPRFLNMAAAAETTLTPGALLDRVLRVEKDLGRIRVIHQGPRTVDVDILLYADRVVDTPRLKIPHPRMQERRFVLEPLAELAPDAIHPVIGKSIRELLQVITGPPK